MHDALREVEKGVLLTVRVFPGSSETAIDEYDAWRKSIRFKTKEPAAKGRANRSALEFFGSLFGKETVLAKGRKSRRKELLVLGATLKEVSEKLKKSIEDKK